MAAGTTKPVLYYNFEAGTGTSVTDRSDAGNSFNATFFNSPTWNSSDKIRGSYALSTGSTNQLYLIGVESSFNFIQTTGIFTVSMWLKASNNSANQSLIGNQSASGGLSGFFIRYSAGASNEITMWATKGYPDGDYAINSDNNAITDTSWHHLVVTADGTNYVFYIDGVAHGAGALPENFVKPSAGDSNNKIAMAGNSYANTDNPYGNGFQGVMDEISIWNVAFTANDITALYNSGKGRPLDPGLSYLPIGIRTIMGGATGMTTKKVGSIAAFNTKTVMGIAQA